MKLFDFGLAKELLPEERGDDGLYLLTGVCGAIRYMAPEVGLKKRYNLSADLYSWSMLMWNILALEPPMITYTPKMFIDRVFQRGYRPVVKDKWPEKLTALMSLCWSEDIYKRPSFKKVLRVLREVATDLDPELSAFWGDDSASRRSSRSKAKSKQNKEDSATQDPRGKDKASIEDLHTKQAEDNSSSQRDDHASQQHNGEALQRR